jgi:hypothetical protein
MTTTAITPQLPTTDLVEPIRVHAGMPGSTVGFAYEDSRAGARIGSRASLLEPVDAAAPSIAGMEKFGHLHPRPETTDVGIRGSADAQGCGDRRGRA